MSEPDGPPTGLPSTLGGDTSASLDELSIARTLTAPLAGDKGWLPTDPDERYQTGEELGRGGIGQVYAAFDQQLGREVAVKVLLEGGSGSSQGSLSSVERRFVHEARITGQLEHPAIVPVHELGMRPDGALFYTMKRVRGRTLAAALAATTDLNGRLALLGNVLDVCQALAYAHSRGIVHRDLKPANVMVGPFGDTVVLDWGLAKQVGQPDVTDDRLGRELAMLEQVQRGRTMVGTALGTPAYMSPEQARGEVDAIDTRSDVWGLGAMLYEVLTGHPPHAGGNALEKARIGDVPAVHTLAPKAPAELVAVVDKALSPEPNGRYADAAALAAELEAWMHGGRVSAFRYGTVDLALRLVRRNKALSTVVALALVGASAGSVALFDAWRVAEARAEEAAASDRAAHGSLSRAYAERAQDLLEEDAATEAAVYAAAALVHAPDSPDGAWYDAEGADPAQLARLQGLLADARARSRVTHVATLGPYGRQVRHMTPSRDGRWLAIQRGGGNTDMVSMEEGRVVHRAKLQAQTHTAVAWLDDGTYWGVGSDGLHMERRRPDGTVTHSFPHGLVERTGRMVASVAATPDGSRVAVRGMESIYLFDDDGTLLGTFHDPMAIWQELSTDGSRMLCLAEGQARLLDTATGEEVARWDGPDRPVHATFHGGRLLLATQEGLRLVDGRTGEPLARTATPTHRVSISPDGRTLLTMEAGKAVLRDGRDLSRMGQLPKPSGSMDPRATLVGNRHVAWVDWDSGGHVLLYERTARPQGRFAPELYPRTLVAGPQGQFVAVGDGDSAGLLDARTTELQWSVDPFLAPQVLPLGGDAVAVSDLRYHLDRLEREQPPQHLVALGPDQVDITPTKGSGPLDGRAAVGAAALAFAQPVGVVQLFDLQGGPLRELDRTDGTEHLAFSPTGERIAVCLRSDVEAHPVDAGAPTTWSLPASCASVAWSPDGTSLVAADAQGGLQHLTSDGTVRTIGRFPAPLTLSWTRSGVVVEAGQHLHLVDPERGVLRTVSRHQPGARHTHVRGEDEQIWFGDGATVRRLPLGVEAPGTPDALLDEALAATGLVLDGFQLALPAPTVQRSSDPRALHGRSLTTDLGYITHGTMQLVDRATLAPLGEPEPIQPDGTFSLVPPEGVDGEVAIRFQADGFVKTYNFSPLHRAGGRARIDTVTVGGMELVHRFSGFDVDWDRPGMAVRVRHTVRDDPYAPVGCAAVTTDPPHPVSYTAGNGDSAMRAQSSTSPVDGQGVLFQPKPGPRTVTATVGEHTASVSLPAIPTGYGTFAVLQLEGADPTPKRCR